MEHGYGKIMHDLHNPDNHDGVITDLEPDILECEVKWALESITTNKASGGDVIPIQLFQILEDNAMKVLHSIRQQIWKTQQWPHWKAYDIVSQFRGITEVTAYINTAFILCQTLF